MSGKPAARITDSVSGSKIVSGSRTVLIGSQGGVACSECPGGVTVGNPVSPSQGAKVLMGEPELDFALPGAMPLVWQRQYSSYVNSTHGASCSLLGYGWSLPSQMRLELKGDACLLFTAMGRVITFDSLSEGDSIYSPSENIWLLRGGRNAVWADLERFRHIPSDLTGDPQRILATNSDVQTLWVLGPGVTPPAQLQATTSEAADPSASSCYVLQGMLDRFGRRQNYERDGQGRVIGITDGVGRRYRLNLQQLHAAKAAQGLWQADNGWRLTGVDLIADPLVSGSTEPIALVRYGYSGAGDLVTVHDRVGRLIREFAWQEHLMVGHRHLEGPRHGYQYESPTPGAKVMEHTNEKGLTYRFEYIQSDTGQVTRVTDSLQRVDVYRFEGEAGLSRLVEHVRADDSRMRHAYDTDGRLVETIDPLGRTTRLRYDGEGRLLGEQRPDGGRDSYDYDLATGRLLTVTDAAGRMTRFDYDAWGRTIQAVLADGSVERQEYPEPQTAPFNCEYPVRIIDAKGGVKHLAWSPAGKLARYTDCSGHASEAQFNRWGQRIKLTNALGQSTFYDHGLTGELDAVRRPDGTMISYRHDAAGRVVQESLQNDPDHSIAFDYDLSGRVTRRAQGGHDFRFAYDLAGRQIQLTNENGAHTRFTWDVMDRLIQEDGFDGRLQAYRYDAAGQLVEALDGGIEDHLSTRYLWDAAGRLAEIHVPATEHGPARTERLQWSPVGELIATKSYVLGPRQPEQLHTEALIERDALGRPMGETQRIYKVQSAGAGALAKASIEFEHTISHKLDPLGNRQASQLQGLGQVDYLMYGSGHLHGLLHNGRSVLDIERDSLHREIKRQQALSNSAKVQTQRQWNTLGRLDRLSIAGLASSTEKAPPFPLVGQLALRDYHYDSTGQLESVQTPGGDKRYHYDALGRLIEARSANRQQYWRFDPAGNRLPSTGASISRSGLSQDTDLWAAQVRSQWQKKDFNVLGQSQGLAAEPGPLVGDERWYDNRVGCSDDTLYRYDSRGNRIEAIRQDGGMLLRYDGTNQLIEVQVHTETATTVSHFIYDSLGRRLSKKVRESAHGQKDAQEDCTYYGWDGDRLVHTEHWIPGRDKQVTHTVYEPGNFTPLIQLSVEGNAPPVGLAALVAQAKNSQVEQALHGALQGLPQNMRQSIEDQFLEVLPSGMQPEAPSVARSIAVRHYHCDHLGTPQALTNEQGQIVWIAEHDPWGNLQQEYNPLGIDQPIRLPGQHHDPETGLYYNRHRYYDPSVGSYINQDPIGLRGGVNPFAYAHQDPLRNSDPLGLYAYAPDVGSQLPGGSSAAGLGGNLLNSDATYEALENGLTRKQAGKSKNCPDCAQVADLRGFCYGLIVAFCIFTGHPAGRPVPGPNTSPPIVITIPRRPPD